MLKVLLIGAGGFLGAIARYLVATKLNSIDRWPWGTLTVNVVGSFLLALLLFWAMRQEQEHLLLLAFAAVGFLGSFTTMSAYAVEVVRLGTEVSWTAGLWAVAHVLACVAAAWLGKLIIG